ncbi:MAG TPA: MFS transporter [Planctomycetota bacterium]|nr:MFS transporter [Planctomycetota bacterium]HRR81570.1 MFS transporter [Planctomycetota bacterium]
MNWEMYLRLCLVVFLQFAIWGAWSPVLAARLFGPLKFTGKQVGWTYGTMYLGCIVSPLIGGLITDRWVATQWFLAAAHLVGGILLLAAARQTRFRSLFLVMCGYALAFAPTLPLLNSLVFRHLAEARTTFFSVSVWGVIAWVLAGWGLTAWRKMKGAGDGSDCLRLAGVLSLVLAVYCLFLPHTPPPETPGEALPFIKAFGLLGDANFLVFIAVAFVVATQLQFYFLGTAPFLGELGVQSKNMPAVMSIAQSAQVLATVYVAFHEKAVLGTLGFRWTLALGAAMWGLLYAVYAVGRPKGVVLAAQALHGMAYAFFIGIGFIYVNQAATADFSASAQALLTVSLFGFGFFGGTQLTGAVMDALKVEGKFRWRAIFLVPCVVVLAAAAALAALFRG